MPSDADSLLLELSVAQARQLETALRYFLARGHGDGTDLFEVRDRIMSGIADTERLAQLRGAK
jgi:hypothetical protein